MSLQVQLKGPIQAPFRLSGNPSPSPLAVVSQITSRACKSAQFQVKKLYNTAPFLVPSIKFASNLRWRCKLRAKTTPKPNAPHRIKFNPSLAYVKFSCHASNVRSCPAT
eukprot:917066-Pelagomonas_calceolata.AAC.8